MIKRLFGSVTIPPRPRPGMDALTFAQGIWKALDQIRGMTYDTGPTTPRRQKTLCPFGEITSMSTGGFTLGIRGGVVYCGDKNFDVPAQGVNLAASGVWLVYLEIDCESNRDDDGEIFLPGIKTSAETTPSTFWDKKTWTTGTSYDDNTNPDVADGLGTIIIPIGKLTVADGSASFEPVACGNVTIDQCAGILSHTRA